MGDISIDGIITGIRVPGSYVNINNRLALQGLPPLPHRILVIGQRLTAGTVAQGVLKQIFSAGDGEAYFGRGSMLAEMIKAAKKANPYTEMWAIAMDEASGGAAAAGNLSFTGPATANGTLHLYIAGKRVDVGVTSADTATAIATAVIAAINAETDLPVTAAVDGTHAYQVNLTARWKGATGNDIDVRVNYQQDEATPAGVGVTVTALSAGTTNPAISTVITAIGDNHYQTFISPWTDSTNLSALESELSTRWGPMVQREGVVFHAAAGSYSTITSLGDGRNSAFSVIFDAGKFPQPPWIVAAVLGATDALEPDPARPRQTLELKGIMAPVETDRRDWTENNALLHKGVATYYVDDSGLVRIMRLITTYQTNESSVADESYLDLTTIRTLAALRYTMRTRIALRYPRHKLASNGTNYAPGQAIVTPDLLRSELLVLFREWEQAGWVENYEQFSKDLLVQRNTQDPNRVDAIIPPDIVNGFMIFAGDMQFRL